jgi:hypothetical protein
MLDYPSDDVGFNTLGILAHARWPTWLIYTMPFTQYRNNREMLNQRKSDDSLRDEVRGFQSAFRSVLMATVNQDGVPEASYAPYVMDDGGRYYVFVSGLARHTRDFQETGHVSLQFIENEDAAEPPCASTAHVVVRRGDDPARKSGSKRYSLFHGLRRIHRYPAWFTRLSVVPVDSRSGLYVRASVRCSEYSSRGLPASPSRNGPATGATTKAQNYQ